MSHGYRHTLAVLPAGDTVLVDSIFVDKLHKPHSCQCLCMLPVGLPAQAEALQGSAPRTESSAFPQAGWMAPGSPGSSGLRVLLCQSLCKVFSQSAMPQKLSPVPCLGPAKVNSWTFVLQQRKDSYSPESLKITYSMLQVQTESPVVWGNWKKDSWNFIILFLHWKRQFNA